MKSLRLRASLTLILVTVIPAFVMQAYTGFSYYHSIALVMPKLRLFSAILVVLLVVGNIIQWRLLSPVYKASQDISRGIALTETDKKRARTAGDKVTIMIIITVIVGFIIGPSIGMIISNLTGITSYTAQDTLTLLFLYMTTGCMVAMHYILSIEHLLAPPLAALEVRSIPEGKKTSTFKPRLIMGFVLPALFVSSLFIFTVHSFVYWTEPGTSPSLLFAQLLVQLLMTSAWSFYLSLLTVGTLTRRITGITRRIRDIAGGGGNLSSRINLIVDDEIGILAFAFNEFVTMLEGLVETIRGNTELVNGSSDLLSRETGRAGQSLKELSASVQMVRNAARNQETVVSEANTSITGMIQSVENIADKVNIQGNYVEESSAAVNQIVANIASVANLAAKASSLAENLSQLSSEGHQALKTSVEAIQELKESSTSVGSIVTSISKIASNTNLLAMNAAIEAAHAGAAGSGFAVVANEIRVLAESSASSAKERAALLKNMMTKIESGSMLAGRAGESFNKIHVGVSDTTELVKVMAESMSEQESGAKEILNSIASLLEATQSIRENSADQSAQSSSVKNAMESIVQSGVHILKALETEEASIQEVNLIVRTVANEADNSRENIKILAESVCRFNSEAC